MSFWVTEEHRCEKHRFLSQFLSQPGPRLCCSLRTRSLVPRIAPLPAFTCRMFPLSGSNDPDLLSFSHPS